MILSLSLMAPGIWYLHSLDGVSGVISLLDEISVLHVLCESLQEAEWLIEDDRHGDLRQLLKRQRCLGLIKQCLLLQQVHYLYNASNWLVFFTIPMHFLSMLQMLKLFLENMGAGKLVLRKRNKEHTQNRIISCWLIILYAKLILY